MSSLMRREPFEERWMRDSMERMMDRWFPRFIGVEGDLALDMYETDDSVVVQVSVPGVNPDDVDVSVMGDTLTIKGEAKSERNVDDKNYVHRELRYGRFSRTVTLPTPVNVDKADAQFKNGVLTVTLPKAEEAKSKTIRVMPK